MEIGNGFRPHTVTWLVVAVGLLGLTWLWVSARRRFLAVAVDDTHLRQGSERLPLTRITEVDGENADATDRRDTGRGRVLGGGFDVPRGYDEVRLRLDDDTTVRAWARDGAALRRALRTAVTDSTP
ncbi:DUF3093 family protein [Saccharomonospora iraqiensis]|uniref:DUF3093 family protein n=1 Tax=Saccharomonospora iraqiensis TaxID=52698 RepID=UPI00022DF494|nr:DUF3093 family protein [Saccharomonospora iraqiensis]